MLISIQDPTIPKCQVLNRDIWNDPKIVDMVREKFIFLQCRREEYRAREYISFHFSVSPLHGNVYPHIAILDPRTGEQLKLWTGYVPKAKDFIADIREFLELYSLNPRAKNPVGTVRGGEIKPMTAAEADEPWYIQSVEQPQSFLTIYMASRITKQCRIRNPVLLLHKAPKSMYPTLTKYPPQSRQRRHPAFAIVAHIQGPPVPLSSTLVDFLVSQQHTNSLYRTR